MTKLAEAFALFAQESGLPVGAPDENGFWHLSYHGVHVAFAEFDEGKWVRAWARVGLCPTRRRAEIFEQLLAYGDPERVTDSAAGSFSLNEGVIFFQQVLPGWKLDLQLVTQALTEIADVTDRMRGALYDLRVPEDAAAPDEGAPDGEFMRFE